jgi:hypothetical protein
VNDAAVKRALDDSLKSADKTEHDSTVRDFEQTKHGGRVEGEDVINNSLSFPPSHIQRFLLNHLATLVTLRSLL